MGPTLEEELELARSGYGCIAGIDEAGRGCWAGPVVAGAVVLGPQLLADPSPLAGADDSKRLSASVRERLDALIRAHASGVGVGVVPAFLIDCMGILAATRLAMQLALLALPCAPDALLIDAVRLEMLPQTQRALIRGDARCLSIAAASIVAKVARDRTMRGLDAGLPGYGFALHKGYGTAAHLGALRRHGPSGQHRQSFRPIADFLATGVWPGRRGRQAAQPRQDDIL
jgi:ribonuclease HII